MSRKRVFSTYDAIDDSQITFFDFAAAMHTAKRAADARSTILNDDALYGVLCQIEHGSLLRLRRVSRQFNRAAQRVILTQERMLRRVVHHANKDETIALPYVRSLSLYIELQLPAHYDPMQHMASVLTNLRALTFEPQCRQGLVPYGPNSHLNSGDWLTALTQLWALDCSGESSTVLAAVGTLTQLTRLCVTFAVTAVPTLFSRLVELRSLELFDVATDRESAHTFAALTNLHTLHLVSTPSDDRDVAPLLVPLTALTSLKVAANAFFADECLPLMSRLRTLALCGLDNDRLCGFRGSSDELSACATALTCLSVHHCCDFVGGNALALLTRLRVLLVGDCPKFNPIAALSTLTTLHALQIGFCVPLTDACIAPLTALRWLGLERTPSVKGSCISALVNLETLRFRTPSTCLTDESIAPLTRLRDLTAPTSQFSWPVLGRLSRLERLEVAGGNRFSRQQILFWVNNPAVATRFVCAPDEPHTPIV